jgi:hypothetical protein
MRDEAEIQVSEGTEGRLVYLEHIRSTAKPERRPG